VKRLMRDFEAQRAKKNGKQGKEVPGNSHKQESDSIEVCTDKYGCTYVHAMMH
jgi:hypothetical protein